MKKQKTKLKARDFDQAFEKGSVVEHLGLKTAKVHHPVQRINIDIPIEGVTTGTAFEKPLPTINTACQVNHFNYTYL